MHDDCCGINTMQYGAQRVMLLQQKAGLILKVGLAKFTQVNTWVVVCVSVHTKYAESCMASMRPMIVIVTDW